MPSDFGDRLKIVRKNNKLTLEALAKKIDSTKSYVWELENKDSVRPSADTVQKLAVALETTVEVLMGERSMNDLESQEKVFFRNYQQLREPTKKKLNEIMKILMKEDDD